MRAFFQDMKVFFRHEPILDPTHRIANMAIGEVAYTVPWCVTLDANGDVSINESFTVSPKPHGTAQLAIRRTDEGIEILSRDIFWVDNVLTMEWQS